MKVPWLYQTLLTTKKCVSYSQAMYKPVFPFEDPLSDTFDRAANVNRILHEFLSALFAGGQQIWAKSSIHIISYCCHLCFINVTIGYQYLYWTLCYWVLWRLSIRCFWQGRKVNRILEHVFLSSLFASGVSMLTMFYIWPYQDIVLFNSHLEHLAISDMMYRRWHKWNEDEENTGAWKFPLSRYIAVFELITEHVGSFYYLCLSE